MKSDPIILIAAIAGNKRVLGYKGNIPWMGKLRSDMKRFNALTKGNPIIAGRKTFDNMGRLKNRENIIVSKNKDFHPHNCYVARSPEAAIAHAKGICPAKPIWILGGQQIYEATLKVADQLYLTIVEAEFEGDTFFPGWSISEWEQDYSLQESHPINEAREDLYPFRYEVWNRKAKEAQ